jgi:hypothetical protein
MTGGYRANPSYTRLVLIAAIGVATSHDELSADRIINFTISGSRIVEARGVFATRCSTISRRTPTARSG